MDVHKENYTVCCYSFDTDAVEYHQKLPADYKMLLKYFERLRKQKGEDVEIVCGYEAGCLGYTLYHDLTRYGVKCVILAPSTMGVPSTHHIKNDRRDAENIARCMATHTYHAVHVPTPEDEAVRDYLRMRGDHVKALKSIKQQILALVLRQGLKFTEGRDHWTKIHLRWLKSLELGGMEQETLAEYLLTYDYLVDKLKRFERRIEEIASLVEYRGRVQKLCCLLGIKTLTALSVIVEIGDFSRFATANHFTSYLGLVPGEHSSGEKQKRTGITKAGNNHVRWILVESAQCIVRGQVGHKSVALRKRQEGNDPNVIAYADKANERMRRKFYRMVLTNKSPRNVAVTAIAREMACFIWGLMTDHVA
jgi:transposase